MKHQPIHQLRQKKTVVNVSLVWLLFAALNLAITCFIPVSCHPIVYRVGKKLRKCISYDFPEGDVLDFVFITTPADAEISNIEYLTTLFKPYYPYGETRMMESVPELPQKFLKGLEKYGTPNSGTVRVKLQQTMNAGLGYSRQPFFDTHLRFYVPVFTKDISINSGDVCFSNFAHEDINFVYDIIPFRNEEEELVDDDNLTADKVIQKEHISVLEKEFLKIVKTGRRITKTMDLVAVREKRMKKTVDGTRLRINFFSYLGIIFLLGTAWIQVRYLKNYFQKKKVI